MGHVQEGLQGSYIMNAVIYDDSETIIQNVKVLDKEEFNDLVEQLPEGWYGELRKEIVNQRPRTDMNEPLIQITCPRCDRRVISSRMGYHNTRNHAPNRDVMQIDDPGKSHSHSFKLGKS
jgi:hypothetical protein